VSHYCVALPVVCVTLLCGIACGVCHIIVWHCLWCVSHYCVALPVVLLCHIIVLVLCLDCLFELNSDALFYFVLVVFINQT